MDKLLELPKSNISSNYNGKFSDNIQLAKNKFLEEFYNSYLSYVYSLPCMGELFNETFFNSEVKKGILDFINNYLNNKSEVVTFNINPNWPFIIEYKILLIYGPIEGQLCIGF